MDRLILADARRSIKRMEPLRRLRPITADFPDGPPLGSVVASRDNPGVRYKILNINKHWVRTSEWAVPVPCTHWDRYGRGVVDRSPDQTIVNYQRRDWDDQMRRWVLIERPPSIHGYTNYPTRRTVDELREDNQSSIREQFRQYQDGLRRYITLTGMTPAQVIANPQILISDKTIAEINKPEETP